jgi:hypothetical protein
MTTETGIEAGKSLRNTYDFLKFLLAPTPGYGYPSMTKIYAKSKLDRHGHKTYPSNLSYLVIFNTDTEMCHQQNCTIVKH